jgi:hypothetical protein
MARYHTSHQTPAGSTLVIINLTGGTTVRPAVDNWTLGSDATPADLAGEFCLMRTTTAGAGGTALSENTRDPLTVAATGAATGGTYTAAPTVTANSYQKMLGLNQRATFEWNANPGDEIFAAATAANGICVYSVAHGGTPNINSGLSWRE